MTKSQTSPGIPAQTDAESGTAILDTDKANRAWALASYLDACDNLGLAPDPAMKAELDSMSNFYSVVDPAEDASDDQIHIEVASYPGTRGSYTEEESPALAGMTVEGLVHVTLTFSEGGKPSIGIQNLTEGDLPVLVHNSEAAGSLYDGIITRS